jgi:hypothetical protein
VQVAAFIVACEPWQTAAVHADDRTGPDPDAYWNYQVRVESDGSWFCQVFVTHDLPATPETVRCVESDVPLTDCPTAMQTGLNVEHAEMVKYFDGHPDEMPEDFDPDRVPQVRPTGGAPSLDALMSLLGCDGDCENCDDPVTVKLGGAFDPADENLTEN